jgi:hypothetical protein
VEKRNLTRWELFALKITGDRVLGGSYSRHGAVKKTFFCMKLNHGSLITPSNLIILLTVGEEFLVIFLDKFQASKV